MKSTIFDIRLRSVLVNSQQLYRQATRSSCSTRSTVFRLWSACASRRAASTTTSSPLPPSKTNRLDLQYQVYRILSWLTFSCTLLPIDTTMWRNFICDVQLRIYYNLQRRYSKAFPKQKLRIELRFSLNAWPLANTWTQIFECILYYESIVLNADSIPAKSPWEMPRTIVAV
jgi:hypothetical protein